MVTEARLVVELAARLPLAVRRERRVCDAELARIRGNHPNFANLAIAAPDGEILCSALSLEGKVNVADRRYFRGAVESRDFVVGEYQIGRVTKKATINFGYPLISAQGGIEAVVTAALDFEWLKESVAKAGLPAGSALTLVDPAGMVLARYPQPGDWVGRTFPEMPLLRSNLERKELVAAKGPDEVMRYHAFHALQTGGRVTYLSVEIPEAPLLTAARRALARNLAILATVTLLVTLLALLLGQRLVLRPVYTLIAAARRFADGDLATRSGVDYATGEIGQLAYSFDKLAQSLQRLLAERERAEGEARAARDHLHALIRASPLAIYTLDLDSRITSWNPAAERLYGWKEEELLGRYTPLIPGPPRTEADHDSVRRRIREAEFTTALEARRQRRDGSLVDVNISRGPLYDAAGNVRGRIVIVTDITERKRMEEDLRGAHDRMRALIEAAPLAIFTTDLESKMLSWNPAAERIYGWKKEEVLGRPLLTVPEDRHAEAQALRDRVHAGEVISDVEVQRRRRDGTLFNVSLSVAPLHDAQGKVSGRLVMALDITSRKRTEARLVQSLSLLQATLDATADGILVVDTTGRIVRYNWKFAQMWGIPEDTLATHSDARAIEYMLGQLKDPEDFLVRVKKIYSQPEAGSRDIIELKDGRVFERHSQPHGIEGEIVGRVWSFSDITERCQAEERLVRLAQYDALTELPNRSLFRDRFTQAMARAARHERMLALMFIDLDGFKAVNDTLGHLAGDALLRQVALRLTDCLRETDTVARMGGDEFNVVLEDVTQVDQVSAVAEKILRAVARPIVIDNSEVAVSASIGITLYPFDAEDLDTMLIQADTAMYRAKKRGRNNYQFFEYGVNVRS